jgi:ABC-type thiamine transport system substrate-binding protein
MNVKRLVQGLSYVGRVDGKRQTYHVFRGGENFFVMSFSRSKPNAGNFNVVASDAVEYVRSRFAGSGAVTTNDVVARAKRSRHIPSSLAALNVLYVLAATGDARIDTRRTGPKLYFNFKRRRA